VTARPGPERLTVETVILELLVFVRAMDSVVVLPSATLPKFKLAGFAVNVAAAAVLVMLKVMGIRMGDPASCVAVAMTFPVYTPAAMPAGLTDTLVVCDVVPVGELIDNQDWSVVSAVGQWQMGTPVGGGQGEVSQIVRLRAAGSVEPAVQTNEREVGVGFRL
jgi:hypothetical protein